jgi:hypothetical protein
MVKVQIKKSTNPKKKLMAVFFDDNGKKIKTTHFGAAGAKDFTTHSPSERDARKKAYLVRHEKRENWSDYKSSGALSRWILWDKPTRSASIAAYKRRFGLK